MGLNRTVILVVAAGIVVGVVVYVFFGPQVTGFLATHLSGIGPALGGFVSQATETAKNYIGYVIGGSITAVTTVGAAIYRWAKGKTENVKAVAQERETSLVNSFQEQYELREKEITKKAEEWAKERVDLTSKLSTAEAKMKSMETWEAKMTGLETDLASVKSELDKTKDDLFDWKTKALEAQARIAELQKPNLH